VNQKKMRRVEEYGGINSAIRYGGADLKTVEFFVQYSIKGRKTEEGLVRGLRKLREMWRVCRCLGQRGKIQ